MAKLSYEDKINIYNKRKEGKSVIELKNEYNIQRSNIYYLINLIDRHGFDILRTQSNKNYTREDKQQIINRVLVNNETLLFVALDEGLSSLGMLINWINKYKENGYNIVERKRGRLPMLKSKPKNEKETIEEENERLKKENLYLKAEIDYSKKLRAVVQARKNQQQKKK